jgi:hypothetical protein
MEIRLRRRGSQTFDLSLDQHEQADFSQKHPEVLQRLMNEFNKWNDQMLPRPPARR